MKEKTETAKAVAIEEEDWIDREWGEIVRCEAVVLDDRWPWDKGTCVPNRNPWEASCDFEVEYANGEKERLTARGWEVLMGLGFRIIGKESLERRFFNIGLMATVARALADGVVIPPGRVDVLDEERGRKVLEEYGIVSYPVLYSVERDKAIFREWKGRWLKSGVCVDDDGGYGLCVSRALLEEEKRRTTEVGG